MKGIKKIFVEEEFTNHFVTENVKKRFPKASVEVIKSYQDYFQKVKKPYLQKRDNLNIFIARKTGDLVKEAPPAYGQGNEKHFYFVHAYNCIYECQYCYLQGYFNSPDLVLFVNYDEIIREMERLAIKYPDAWFHAGEFSDSLALSDLTGELPYLHKFAEQHPNIKVELRTKSVNLREGLKLSPLKNIIYSFSLSPEKTIKEVDLGTPPLRHKIKAISELQKNGYPIALHFDPICYTPNWSNEYHDLINLLGKDINLPDSEYFSLGVVRFTKDVYFQFKKNYPDSTIHQGEFTKSFDGKVRYHRPYRMKLMNEISNILVKSGVSSSRIYKCME